MRSDDLITERDECLIWTLTASDLWLSADSSDPLIPTDRRIARFSALRILPSAGKYLLSSAEQAPEERNFVCGWRGCRHTRAEERSRISRRSGPSVFECVQSVGELRPFPVEPGQPIFQSRNLAIDVVSVGDLVAPFSCWT
jgi:hypothetical protein